MPTVNIRSVPEDVRARFNAGASLRSLTLAAYLEALLDLHDTVRRYADSGGTDQAVIAANAILNNHGLQTVHATG